MDSNLKKIIKLIKKTGDKFIVSDSDFEALYVVMALEDYENSVMPKWEEDFEEEEEIPAETSETQLLEKINHDIAVWKSQQEKMAETLDSFRPEEKKEESAAEENANFVVKNTPPKEEEENVEDRYYFEPLET